MPAETTGYTGLGDPTASNKITCVLDSFSLDPPSDAQMKIDFPAGCLVMDDVNHELYRLNADGTKTYQDYFDANTGKTIHPPTRPSTEP